MLQHSNPEIQSLIERVTQADREARRDDMLELIHLLEQTAQQHEDRMAQLAARYYLATYQYVTEQRQEALHLALEVAALAAEQGATCYAMHAHNLCGIIYEELSDYSSCLDQYLTAYDLALYSEQNDYLPYPLVNVGNLFMFLDDFESSLFYSIEGFHKFQQITAPTLSNLYSMAIAALNIIEAYIGCGNYREAVRWTDEQGELLKTHKKFGIAECFLIIGRVRIGLQTGDLANTERELRILLSDTADPENFNNFYTLSLLLSAFNLAIDMGSRALADQLLEALDHTRREVALSTADYKLESSRIRYYDRFFAEDEDYLRSKKYFYTFFQVSQASLRQLSVTYTSSLHMRTELDKVKEEQRTVQVLNAQLRHSMDMDPFTGIYNKMSLSTRVEERMADWIDGQLAALFVLDIDHFKRVNDTYGHQLGDRVIEGVADLLKHLFREEAVVGRLGGDEFVVFLVGASEKIILDRAEALLKRARSFRPEGQPDCAVTLSIGVHLMRRPEPYEDMVAEADRALYTAKQQGRDRYVVA